MTPLMTRTLLLALERFATLNVLTSERAFAIRAREMGLRAQDVYSKAVTTGVHCDSC